MFSNLYKSGISFTNRLITGLYAKNEFELKTDRPIISFTFDDFPQSAAKIGLELLIKYNLRATYYISFGLIGKVTATGKICEIEKIVAKNNSSDVIH